MASNKDEESEIESDSEFLNSIEHPEELPKTAEVLGDQSDEDFDFDGHDIVPDSIPSWIDSEQDEFDTSIIDDLEEGFTLVDGEKLLEDNVAPDTADLFGPASQESLGEMAALEEQRDAYLEALRQLQADFENYKKRVVRDQLEDAEIKSVKLMEELLPVIDNFQLALKTIEGKDPETKKLRKGIELVYNDLYSVLERQGLEPIEAEGALFDPEFHDAVAHDDNDEHEQEIVVEVLRPGYKVRGRVVRPAMVKVAK